MPGYFLVINKIMSTLHFWIKNARSISLPQSLLPCLTAIILCIGQEGFVWWLALPILLGIAAAHLGMNLADDYFDFLHDSHSRSELSGISIRARMEKCSYLAREGETNPQQRVATVNELKWAIIGFIGFAALMGGIAFVAQWLLHGYQATFGIIIYALLGLFLGINYSGKPFELGYHGLGELVIGIIFGPLNMMGVQAALTGNPFSWQMLCISLGIGCMVINILYVHSVMEVNADAALGKMTFARLVNGSTQQDASKQRRGLMIFFIGFFALMPFVMLGVGITLGWWSPWYLMTLLTLPMSIYLIHSTRLFAYGLPRNDTPHWWMGPMGDWENYVKADMAWFLYRWLLARNICTFFCLILMLMHIVGLIVG